MAEANGHEGAEAGRKKGHPTRGKRYAPALKKEILEFADNNGVESAAKKHGVTETTSYEWRRAAKRRGRESGAVRPGQSEEEDSKAQRHRTPPCGGSTPDTAPARYATCSSGAASRSRWGLCGTSWRRTGISPRR